MHGIDPTNGDIPIGVFTGMSQDSKGLYVQGKLALKTQRGAEAYELMKMEPRPAISGLSIGYRATKFVKHPAGQMPDGRRRTLISVHLGEVSLVTDPANSLARVSSVKSYDAGDKVLLALRRLADLS
jgi:Escherichia/Staphylococcus phage prohead protease